MNRLNTTFERIRACGERALIPYLTAGFPDQKATPGLLTALVAGGADIIELGVPFSDPIADGPTIQKASAAALAAGMSVPGVLQIVREFRKESQTPIVLFGAYNPFFHYGLERFAADAASAGADAVLIPDLPVDEGTEAEPALHSAGLELIYLIAPTTPLERKRMICSRAAGFIYYISVKGVTGARAALQHDLEIPLAEIRACTKLPVAVGFGISTPAQAAAVAKSADGVVVGSALIDLISSNRNSPDLNGVVEAYMRSMKDSISAIGKT